MTAREREKGEIDRLTAAIAASSGSWGGNPTFIARDLGFPEHTAIHDLVRPLLARFAATILVTSGAETAHLFQKAFARPPSQIRNATLSAILNDTCEVLDRSAAEIAHYSQSTAKNLTVQAEAIRDILKDDDAAPAH